MNTVSSLAGRFLSSSCVGQLAFFSFLADFGETILTAALIGAFVTDATIAAGNCCLAFQMSRFS
jgi:hypothetical protein